jgi:hypothetical protein
MLNARNCLMNENGNKKYSMNWNVKTWDSNNINFGHIAVAATYPLRLNQSCTVILGNYPCLLSGRITQILILGFMENLTVFWSKESG